MYINVSRGRHVSVLVRSFTEENFDEKTFRRNFFPIYIAELLKELSYENFDLPFRY